MPYNLQTKFQSTWNPELLPKLVKLQQISQNQPDSDLSGDLIQIAEGKWEDDQNLKFVVFIDFHAKIFSSKQKRKSEKIFKHLSKHLGNRTPAQCRSHYQKIMIKFKTIAKLKKYFKEYFGEELYNREFKEFRRTWINEHPEPNEQNVTQQPKEVREFGIQTEPTVQILPEFQQMWMMWQMQQWTMSFFTSPFNFWAEDKAIEQ